MGNKAQKAVIAVAALFLMFVAGLVLGVNKYPPAGLVTTVRSTLGDLKVLFTSAVFKTPEQHLRPLRGDLGNVPPDQSRTAPGVTFVSGLFGQKLGFRLYGPEGNVIHEWPIDFFTVAPELMEHRYHALIHGEHLYENGDVVANLDGRALIRFDRCGKILWTSMNGSHHSVHIADDGTIWTPTDGTESPENGIVPFGYRMDSVGVFDPNDGTLLRTFDLPAAFEKLDQPGLIQPDPRDASDLIHLNDAEPLSAAMAPAFPRFAAGDLLVSSRNLDQLWVLDGKTQEIKWTFSGPMRGQHDPDFQQDGTITVFDNRSAGEASATNEQLGHLGGSRILAIDPSTGTARVVFGATDSYPIYSPFRGKHQMLPNGNILITETDAGRVVEVTSAGDVVWSLVNGWDDTRVGWVMGATRYPDSYAAFTSASCE